MTGSIGVSEYGVYVPYWRLEHASIGSAVGTRAGKGMRAVAAYDEDTTTLAVEAAGRRSQPRDARRPSATSCWRRQHRSTPTRPTRALCTRRSGSTSPLASQTHAEAFGLGSRRYWRQCTSRRNARCAVRRTHRTDGQL